MLQTGVKRPARFVLLAACTALAGCFSTKPMFRDHAVDLLAKMAQDYRAKAADRIVDYYSEDASIEDPTHESFERGANGDDIQVIHTRRTGTRDDLRTTLARHFARIDSVEKAKFVLDDARKVGDRYELDAWFNMMMTRVDGMRCHEESWHRFVVDSDKAEMRIVSHRVIDRYVVEGKQQRFFERAKEVGLGIVHESYSEVVEGTPIIPGNNSGSGASAGDLDGDGYLDLVIGDGERTRVFVNSGDGTFRDVTEKAIGRSIGKVRGAYLVDYDNDGRLDIFLTRVKVPLVLLRNLGAESGELRFEDKSDALAAFTPAQAESAAFADLDHDGDLDAFVCCYGDFAKVSWAFPLYNATDGEPDVLLRNDAGTFAKVDVPAATPPGWALAVALGDYDDDGDADIYIVNDFGVNHLIRNDGAWRFTEVTDQARVADQGFGMSAAFGDPDNDGDLDIYVANMHSSAKWVFEEDNFPLHWVARLIGIPKLVRREMKKVLRGNTYFRNDGGKFEQMAGTLGVERCGWAWGANYLDFDNDGDLDIYSPNGYITGKDPADC